MVDAVVHVAGGHGRRVALRCVLGGLETAIPVVPGQEHVVPEFLCRLHVGETNRRTVIGKGGLRRKLDDTYGG
jgi:hypothetical protein